MSLKQSVRFFSVLFAALITVSCSNEFFAPNSISTDQTTSVAYSEKEILISEGGVSEPFYTLGLVEYSLKSDFSIFSSQEYIHNQALDYLKQEALARYGDKVDAIMNVEFTDTKEGYFNSTLTNVKGIAIAFKPGAKPIIKNKRKYKVKSTKSSNPSKAKPSTPQAPKTNPAAPEPEFTPSELLK